MQSVQTIQSIASMSEWIAKKMRSNQKIIFQTSKCETKIGKKIKEKKLKWKLCDRWISKRINHKSNSDQKKLRWPASVKRKAFSNADVFLNAIFFIRLRGRSF